MSSTRNSFGSGRDMYGGGAIPSTPIIRGISTSASSVQGGVTTYDNGGGNSPSGPRRVGEGDIPPLPDGACPNCYWVYDKETNTWYCKYCDCDPYDGPCDHHCVPIGNGKDVWFFMAALAGAYALYKVRAGKKEII